MIRLQVHGGYRLLGIRKVLKDLIKVYVSQLPVSQNAESSALFQICLPNPFVYEKPPLQRFLVTAAGRAVHQAQASWKLLITS